MIFESRTHPQERDTLSRPVERTEDSFVVSVWGAAAYGSSRTQMLRKLMGSLLSPCAWSLMAAPSKAL